jgi:hypothetical protein
MRSTAHPANDIVIGRRFEHARVVNLLAGLWLVASTWLWKHFEPSQLNTWLVGAFVSSFALLALRTPVLRCVNALLGAWLLLSTLLVIRPVAPATWWNNLLVAVTVLGCALLSHRGAATTLSSRTFPSSKP